MRPCSLIDLHCDTLYELEKSGQDLSSDSLAVCLPAMARYARYVQFFASWCSSRLDDDAGYAAFLRMADRLDAELARPDVAARLCKVTTAEALKTALQEGRHAAVLAVEDARILGGELTRLDVLAARGVRYLTLCWGGESCIGGAFDTDAGLTPFGAEVVRRCFALGVVPDLSHTNPQSAQDAIELAQQAQKPLLATHSNAYSVYPHPRNLRDEHFVALRDGGGLVGLNFYRAHLCDEQIEAASLRHLVRHLEHYLSLGGEDTVAIGGDWDGCRLPDGLHSIADAALLADELARLGYSDALIQKLFFDNAYAFILRNF